MSASPAVRMDSASASAKAMAAATSTKPRPSPLPTPNSASFPSSLHSPAPTPGFMRAERDRASQKTPLTPPPAWLQYLKDLKENNGLRTPLATSKSASFSFSESQRSPYPWPNQPASARPNLHTYPSVDSATSNTSTISAPPVPVNSNKPLARRSSNTDSPSASPAPTSAPQVPRSVSLPSHPRKIEPARRPSLIIPESPSSTITTFSAAAERPPSSALTSDEPRSSRNMSPPSASFKTLHGPNSALPTSATSQRSPATANAAKSYYTSISPDGSTPRTLTAPGFEKRKPYTVRHVYKRTVTYTRPAGTTARLPGLTPQQTLAADGRPTSAGLPEISEGSEDGRSERSGYSAAGATDRSSGAFERSRTSTPRREDIMKLDTILNSTSEPTTTQQAQPGEKRAPPSQQTAQSQLQSRHRPTPSMEITAATPISPVEQTVDATPLAQNVQVGEVPLGKRRKMG